MTIERGSRLINRYKIVEILGQGGMGSIYRAVDENLGVEVAVKENLFTSEEYARQFRREAVILANLRHPNLPRVTDHFVIDGQGQYLVMDYIEGEDLRERIDRQGLLSDADAVILGTTICDALSYLHACQPQVVHRDIKPGNIKITSNGNVILVDFGLAKVTQGSQVTSTGARAMTPGYSPPEQYGTARTDHRSDIYSLGASLYMALTGALPEDALARAMGQIDLTPIRKHNPNVSRRLAAVIEKAMELRPEQRYQTAEDFKQALINTRVITGRKAAKEATLTPVIGGVAAVTNSGNVIGPSAAVFPRTNQANQSSVPSGSSSLPANRANIGSEGIILPGNRRISCWMIGAFFLLLIAGIMAGVYLIQPELVNQAIAMLPDNFLSMPILASSNTPTPVSGIATLSPEEKETMRVVGVEMTATPNAATPTPSPENSRRTSTATLTPTKRSQPTATFTPTPAPLGGGAGQIAFASDITGLPQIWLMNSDGTAAHQITDMPEGACQPAWSPDGERIAYISPCAGNQEIYPGATIFITRVNDPDNFFSLPLVPGGDFDPAWSPDGNKIVFTSLRDYNRAQVYEFNLEDNSTRSLSANTVRDSQPIYSPDGREIAFVTTRRGPYQIWIMDKDGNEAMLLSRSGSLKDTHPVWSPDGGVIMFTQSELLGGVPRLAWMRVEEGNLIESRVVQEVIPMKEASYSPDGAWIAFESWPDGSTHDIYIMTPKAIGRQRLTDEDSFEFDPAWRP
jgi:serine/threonine protein kinase/Tol biopolymer transport system component